MNRNCRCFTLICLAILLGACSAMPQRDPQAWEPVPPPVVAEPHLATSGAIISLGGHVELFSDLKARRVGDIITIELVEKTDARKSSSTNTSKDTAIDNASATLFGVELTRDGTPFLRQRVDGNTSFAGEGASAQSNQLSGSITVTVAQRQPNGNLYVRGEKWITLNQGREFIRIAGIVRPYDIGPDNVVSSEKVADAQIIYSGRGALHDANRQGWLTRFFNNPVMPF